MYLFTPHPGLPRGEGEPEQLRHDLIRIEQGVKNVENPIPRVLYCRCAYARVVPEEVKDEVLARPSPSRVAFDAVPGLCEMSAKSDPLLPVLAGAGDLRIAACYPRAVKWLFNGAGAPLPAEGVAICNMRVESAEQVVSRLLAEPGAAEEAS